MRRELSRNPVKMWLLISEREIIFTRAEVKLFFLNKKRYQRVTATNEHIYKRTQKRFLEHLT